LFYTNKNFYELFSLTPGIGPSFKKGVLNRLELKNCLGVNLTPVTSFKQVYRIEVINFLNQYYSQINSVNNIISDLERLNIIRLYLIKSYRGKCHAIGKPSNGQRTWSNGWTAYNTNYILRKFLNETRFKLKKDHITEKINYKLTKKKYITKKKNVGTTKRKVSIWF
jgi:ribosomal protein S13